MAEREKRGNLPEGEAVHVSQTDTASHSADVPPSPQTPRDIAFDILKGISILEVICHHLLSYSARRYAVPGSIEWWTMMLANRVLHFAVPAFLLATALLLARSAATRVQPDWKRFYWRRAERTLWPYLVWTLIYIAFRVQLLRAEPDILPSEVNLPWGGTVTLPVILADAKVWRSNLIWGKGYYHLYFMSVLLQFCLVFPLLFCAVKRTRPGFGMLLLVCVVLQGGAFHLHAQVLLPVLQFTTPASSLLWYLPPVLIGVWLGVHWQEWASWWSQWRIALRWLTGLGAGVYLWLSWRQLQGVPIPSPMFNAAYLAYATGIALELLAWCQHLVAQRIGDVLARIGDWSLPLFLVHPAVLFFFGGPRATQWLNALPAPFLWLALMVLTASWGVTALVWRLKADRLLFGRSLAPSAARSS
ncbi:MAG: acyltransferase [Chloroherpetonaceae bacterium]|nr:acyltransferase [Chthonomonadaceae bacterium]MDW8206437.1 acyltransferase [Chloroherpetonaceae bacterium]